MNNLSTTIDQIGREVVFSIPPKRIVSLVPSQTEFLLDIGAPVVGRTKFCVHPELLVKKIPIIGGTKKFLFERIYDLQPDIIIGNKEENYKEGIEILAKDFPVWLSDITSINKAYQMMIELGRICDLESSTSKTISECREKLEKVRSSRSGRVVYMIWKNPWMVAGRNTFINEMLHYLGYINCIAMDRYPEVSESQLVEFDPEIVMLSSEPYPFGNQDLDYVQKLLPDAQVMKVDGELYSWFGSRLRFWD